MPKKETYSLKTVADALRATGGLKAEAARKLMCHPTTISHYIKRHPELEKVCQEAAEATLDLAEAQLIENIRQGKEPSIFFYLKCKGKSRGFVEKDQAVTLEAMISVMEKMASVVIANVKDRATLRSIQEKWDSISL